jgi:hypothetical protein
MSFPLEDARLCLDCDTVFDEARCPSCDSETYFPLSRWVRPANESGESGPPKPRQRTLANKAKNTSLVLGGAGVAFALWKMFGASKNGPEKRPPDHTDSSLKKRRSRKTKSSPRSE